MRLSTRTHAHTHDPTLRACALTHLGRRACACVCVRSDPWQVLGLDFNQIGDVGVSALARAAEAGSLASLTFLYLKGATASAETRDAMKAAMAKRGGRVVW